MKTNGKLKLIDGSELETITCSTKPEPVWTKDVQRAEEELFVHNAHFLLSQAPRVFADSRLFLSPVRIRSGMAYTGPFPAPCLGGYLEWWINAKCATRDADCGRELVYFVSGSPLSGHNVSMAVRSDGTRCRVDGLLLPLAKSYSEVMKRYQEPMRNCASYTLEESVNILRGRQNTFECSLQRIVLEQKVETCSHENVELKKTVDEQRSLIKAYQKALCRAVVREFPDEVRLAIRQANLELESGSPSARKGSANRPITMLFNAFARREGIVLSAPSKRFLVDELARVLGLH